MNARAGTLGIADVACTDQQAYAWHQEICRAATAYGTNTTDYLAAN